MSIRHELDARRLLCPMPVIRTQNYIKRLQPGDELLVTATDPGVKADIPAWCRVNGHHIVSIVDLSETKEIQICVRVGA